MIKRIGYIFLLLLITTVVNAQSFADEIKVFKAQDSISFPPKKAILFVGSSSFRKWTDVQSYFPGYKIINRGFGGSTLPDVIRYADDIIFPYKPKQIVIYCGENDLATSDTVTAAMVTERFKSLFLLIRKKMPNVPIAFVSLKPSPSRDKLWPKMIAANDAIRTFLKGKSKTAYIDVYYKMFNSDGSVKKELFIEDNLHMNSTGYTIWQKSIKPYLLKD